MTTPAPTTTQAQEVDGSDESDHDAAEVALGAALGAVLLAWLLPGPSSFLGKRGLQRSWDDQVAATIGPVIQGFLQRSAADVAAQSTDPGASVIALQTAEQTYPQILSWIQARSYDTLQNLTNAPGADDVVAARVTTAAENLARGAAVYAKSEVREQTVGKLGAVWKIWRTRHDDRVRTLHRELEGSKVPFGGTFIVDGIQIKYPGDPDAPLEMTAGCRCHLNYRLQPEESSYGEV